MSHLNFLLSVYYREDDDDSEESTTQLVTVPADELLTESPDVINFRNSINVPQATVDETGRFIYRDPCKPTLLVSEKKKPTSLLSFLVLGLICLSLFEKITNLVVLIDILPAS